MAEKKSLAKIVGDITDLETFIAKDEFLTIVNQDPSKFVENHPIAKNVKFMPIGVIETLLTKIFQDWYVEVIETKQLFQSISVTVRLNYMHPVTNKWLHQDGVGAVPVQTDAGKSAADLSAIKNDAVMKALPAAKSFAIKDAAEHIGRLFGRDINRKDMVGFEGAYATKQGKTIATKKKNELRKKLQNEDS